VKLRALLFWLRRPPETDPEKMTFTAWSNFLDLMGGWLLVSVLVAVLLAVILYAIHARSRRILHPADYFQPYTPLRWPLLIALLPAALLVWRYIVAYRHIFPDTAVSPLGDAVSVAAVAAVVTWLISRLVTMLPGITPSLFRYRSLSPLIPSAAAGKAEVKA
jgi:hypothetical protein